MNKLYLSVIGILSVVIILQRQCAVVPKPCNHQAKIDTVYKNINLVETKKLTVFRTVTKWLPGDTIFIPDTNYNGLKEQYIRLSQSYSNKNIYRDTVRVDSLGSIIVLDTLQYNVVRSRTTSKNFSIPVIIKTVPSDKILTRQLYVGGEVAVSAKPLNLAMIQASVLYKNKRDALYGVHAGFTNDGVPFYGLSTYWKIKLK